MSGDDDFRAEVFVKGSPGHVAGLDQRKEATKEMLRECDEFLFVARTGDRFSGAASIPVDDLDLWLSRVGLAFYQLAEAYHDLTDEGAESDG